MEANKIVHGDAFKVLQSYPDNSVDCAVTDPPYGYSFMDNDWDKVVPPVSIWRELLRTLKPGGFAFIMSAPRQNVLSHMFVNLQNAGFKTDFSSIYWAYANGYPHSLNVGKYSSDSTLKGCYGGFQPKPAVEVIIVAMKALSERNFTEQAITNRKGVTWLDDCRIPFEDTANPATNPLYRVKNGYKIAKNPDKNPTSYTVRKKPGKIEVNPEGRYPANLLVSDNCLDDGKVHTSGTIEPHHLIDHQKTSGIYGKYENLPADEQTTYGDSGSFNRYFSLDAWFEKQVKKLPLDVQKTFPFLIVNKASRKERNVNLKRTSDGKYGNMHPTVKPLALMSYLITLGSRHNDLIIDPFCGTGTTCLAAKMLGRQFVGIELNAKYVEIAQKRVGNHKTLFEFASPEPHLLACNNLGGSKQ